MAVTITAEAVIQAAALAGALGALGGGLVWLLRFVEGDRKQDKELAAIRKEQSLICFGVLACLQGLKEQGCDGPVTEALGKLEAHLNKAAHDGGA